MAIWDSKCVWYILWPQDIIGFWDIYRKMDGKWLLDSMAIWDSKCVSVIRRLQDTIRFYDVYTKRDSK